MAGRASIAGVLLAALAIGCGSGGGDVKGPVSVYVSLPLTGPRGADGRDAADGARLALEQAGGRGGGLEVEANFLDDAKGARWDPVTVGANARTAVQDSSTAAYIGELDSEPTRGSAPITNDAGIVQISAGAGGVDLTEPAEGYPDSPDRYRPSGSVTFVRLVPTDAVQARAAAEWAGDLGFRRIRVVSDGTPFGDLNAAEFTTAAEAAGVEVLAQGERGAAPVFLAGEGGENEVPPGTTSILATDAALQSAVGPEVGFFTAAALDPSRLPDPRFAADFEQRFGRAPGPYAAYGFEAMSLALAGIDEAEGSSDGFRGRVTDAVLGADRTDSVLGQYSVTDEGDATLCAVQRYSIEGGVAKALPIPDTGEPCPSG